MAENAQDELVPMIRDAGQYPAPHAADVHRDEVERYRLHGWVENGKAEDEKPNRRKAAAKTST